MSQRRVFSISELTSQVKNILESSLPILWVEGEISDFTWHSSGHMYFSLKDQYALLRCVMWKSHNQHLFFSPGEGMKVQLQGKITLYQRGGQYQLTVYQMEPQGAGELRIAFERLASALRAEGLFRQDLKKPLPRFPTRIGVVTSPTGAALQDIIRVISRRFPPARIQLKPVPVQGEGAGEKIARAVDELNRENRVQVIIIGRGGGSPEDLWAFNEERVARAIHRSHIPVVSGVGHEVDLTISDLVADLRAPTPSAAAEMTVPSRNEVLALLAALCRRMHRATESWLMGQRHDLISLGQSRGMRRPTDLISLRSERVDALRGRVMLAWDRLDGTWQQRLQAREKQLRALDPSAVLNRGYSVCRRAADMTVVKDARKLKPADAIEVTLARGCIDGTVRRVRDKAPGRGRRAERNG